MDRGELLPKPGWKLNVTLTSLFICGIGIVALIPVFIFDWMRKQSLKNANARRAWAKQVNQIYLVICGISTFFGITAIIFGII